MNNTLQEISIRGRVTYIIMCFERYVMSKYPDRDWQRVDDMMWKICDDSDYIDNSAYRYMEIIPEYLYEFDSFAESDFDYLTESDYGYYKSVIPKDDADLDKIMHSIYWVAMEYAYTGIPKNAPDTIPYIENVEAIMLKRQLPLPDTDLLKDLVDREHWWGEIFDGRYLSIILNP